MNGPKIGEGPFWGRRAWSPSNTKSPWAKPSFIPSDILIHAAIWLQQIWAENWGAVPLWGGGLGPHLTKCGQAEAYLLAEFHLDPSNRLATVHDRHRQDRQTGQTRQTDRQRSDSIGRTVLQTVAQKCNSFVSRPIIEHVFRPE